MKINYMKKLLLVLLVLIVLSFTLYQKAANQRNAAAQYNLGIMYEKGQGVTQSYVKAAKFYQKAATHGDTSAQNKLGSMYVKGQGVKQNDVKAKELFRKACGGGSEWGCKAYGILNKR
ncbi:hypothetical protein MNB_SM-4-1351 [hydrothermal vent metagenome]|uniref:Beta-lactamase n=1 Tax=hydrothermal vent metagenome TaxID=652676 RepID=A0A1W1CQT9_9ZZZZ